MNKKQFLITGSVIVFLLVAAVALSFIHNSMKNNPVATSTQAPTGTASVPPPRRPLINEYAINLPNALLLLDSQGRRTGKDPATGTLYREIPGTSYGEEGRSGQLYFSTPPAGQYTLYILGGQTGQYHLDSWVDNGGSQPPAAQRISGDIQVGSMIVYSQNYDPAHIPSSTVSFQGAASSTASITSAPPNNLPPPQVPQ